MSHSTKFGDRRGSIAAAVTVVLLLVGGILVANSFSRTDAPPQPDAAQSTQPAPALHGTGSATTSRQVRHS